MIKLKILLISIILLSFSGDKKVISTTSIFSDVDEPEPCIFDWVTQNNLSSKPEAAIINWPRWETGEIIKIKFLDGEIWQHELVKKYVAEWAKYANLKFEYVPKDQYGHIRIGFDLGGTGAWSVLGKSSISDFYDQNQPTMRLGTLKVAKEEWAARTILHEFGHALGLHHETQNPAADIKWDLPKTYKYYNEIMGWSKEETDLYVISKESSTNYSEYDPLSIMHYYIPASITTDGKAVNEMSVLSDIDKISINKWYPFPSISIIESGGKIMNSFQKPIKSSNGNYSLNFLGGYLCIIKTDSSKIIWGTGNPTLTDATCTLQADGNIVIKGILPSFLFMGQAIFWTSNTSEYPGAKLHLQDDGDLLLIYNGVVKWSSKNGKI